MLRRRLPVACPAALVLAAAVAPVQASTRQCVSSDGTDRYECSRTIPAGDGIDQILPANCDRFRDFTADAISRRISAYAHREVPLPSFLLRYVDEDVETGAAHRLRVRVTLSDVRRRVTAINHSKFAVSFSFTARCRP